MGCVAIRNRLDRLIAAYRGLYDCETSKRAILEKLERGEIAA